MAEDGRCPECGGAVTGGRAGCEAYFDTLRYLAPEDYRVAAIHRLAFDTYCMQHVETYCRSAKSYAAHLVGLCCGVERQGDPALYDAIYRCLNGSVALDKPPILRERGRLTLVNVWSPEHIEESVRKVRLWAEDVWAAYRSQHELARAWAKDALARPIQRRTP